MSGVPPIVHRWQQAWASLDPDRIAALYAENGTHMSAVVRERMGIADGTLKGREEVRAYAKASAERLKNFEAVIIDVIAENDRASVEYWRVLDGNTEKRTRVIEILEWQGEEITACRVFHF